MTSRKIMLCALAMLALVGCGGGGGSSSAAANAAPAAGMGPPSAQNDRPNTTGASSCSVAFWGDSIAELVGQRKTALDIRPHWLAGSTTGLMLAGFLQDPLAERFIVLEWGVNNANWSQPIEADLRAMLDRVKAMGRTAVLTGTSHATTVSADAQASVNATIAQLAKEYGAIYADWPGVAWSPDELNADGLHPGPVYLQRLADALSAAILQVSPECKR